MSRHRTLDAAESSRLPSEVQREIVVRLARFETPTEVQQAIRAQYGRELALPRIVYYDATSANPDLAAEWRELFRATREAFVRETAGIGVAHLAVRLRKLDRMVNTAMARGAHLMAGKLLEQAAKEVGGYYTNVQIIKTGDPVEELARLTGMTTDELRALPPATGPTPRVLPHVLGAGAAGG